VSEKSLQERDDGEKERERKREREGERMGEGSSSLKIHSSEVK
jgi:hypothetical protein